MTVTILPVSRDSARASCSLFAPCFSSTFTTRPSVCEKLPTVADSCASRARRSVMTTTLSKTGSPGLIRPSASASGRRTAGSRRACRSLRRWASHPMVFDLPDPADAMIR
ncbi:hypothetical protein GCM10020256_08610 [Streptomyces thermocoprophilus]